MNKKYFNFLPYSVISFENLIYNFKIMYLGSLQQINWNSVISAVAAKSLVTNFMTEYLNVAYNGKWLDGGEALKLRVRHAVSESLKIILSKFRVEYSARLVVQNIYPEYSYRSFVKKAFYLINYHTLLYHFHLFALSYMYMKPCKIYVLDVRVISLCAYIVGFLGSVSH